MGTAACKESAMATYMAPVDPKNNSMPDTNNIISHQHNSHTFYPKVVGSPAELFTPYNNMTMVDFPGMFDSKGVVLDIALELSLQRLLKMAKSSRIALLVSAGVFVPGNNLMVTEIKAKLKSMFKEPWFNVVIAVTKAQMYPNNFDEDEVLSMVLGE